MSSRSRSPRSRALASVGEAATVALTAAVEATRAAVAAYEAARLVLCLSIRASAHDVVPSPEPASNSLSIPSGPSLSGTKSLEEPAEVSWKMPLRSPCIVPHSSNSDGCIHAPCTPEGPAPAGSEWPYGDSLVDVAPLCTEVGDVERAEVADCSPLDEDSSASIAPTVLSLVEHSPESERRGEEDCC